MSENRRTVLLVAVSVGIFTAGLLTALYAQRQAWLKTRPQIARKLRAMEQLHAVENEANRYLRAESAWREVAGPPVPLKDLLEPGGSALTPEDTRVLDENGPPGWRVLRREFTLSDAPLADVIDFVQRAESARPPWKLVRCTIHASPHQPGRARVVLRLQTLVSDQ